MRRFAKPLYGLTPVPRVRIPPSPPDSPDCREVPYSYPKYAKTLVFRGLFLDKPDCREQNAQQQRRSRLSCAGRNGQGLGVLDLVSSSEPSQIAQDFSHKVFIFLYVENAERRSQIRRLPKAANEKRVPLRAVEAYPVDRRLALGRVDHLADA